MNREESIRHYIKNMRAMKGLTQEQIREYIAEARQELSILRRNEKSDPERFAKLEKRREEIRQAFLGQEIPLKKVILIR